MKFKKKIALLLDDEKGNTKGDVFVEYFISGLIIINTITIILESYEEINTKYFQLFRMIEIISIIIFSIEYITRIWVSDLLYPKLSARKARLKYTTSFVGIIDLIAILPFYIPFLFKVDLRIIRILRLFRLLRILKLNRHFKSLRLIKTVINKTMNEILVTVFLVFILHIFGKTPILTRILNRF